MHLTVRMARIDGPDPPFDHNFLLGSAVYARLREDSPEASQAIHDSHLRSAYVLSEIHRVPRHSTESWFRIGTSHERVATLVSKALAPGTTIPIARTTFRVTGTDLHETVARPGEYATLSPILLTDKATRRSVVNDSPGYREFLEVAVNAQILHNTKREGAVRVLQVEPQDVRKRTIKERTVLAQKARLLLDGPEEELRFLVDHGIGRSPALGFGMVVGADDSTA